jgi:thiol-disulfide isomerase/thioredoxin
MNRRALMALVGVGAGLGGAGLAWWRLRPGPVLSGAEEAFWAQRYERPEGGELIMADLRGRPLLVNFWATWCPPCIEELPLLNAFAVDHARRGWQVVGLAVDRVEPVRSFLQRLPLSFPVGMAGLAGTELSRTLGNANGGLPFTVVMDRQGRAVHRKIGKVRESDLEQWLDLV